MKFLASNYFNETYLNSAKLGIFTVVKEKLKPRIEKLTVRN
jgi:hypothetical protein